MAATAGPPPRPEAVAAAQHLWSGAFSFSASIGYLRWSSLPADSTRLPMAVLALRGEAAPPRGAVTQAPSSEGADAPVRASAHAVAPPP